MEFLQGIETIKKKTHTTGKNVCTPCCRGISGDGNDLKIMLPFVVLAVYENIGSHSINVGKYFMFYAQMLAIASVHSACPCPAFNLLHVFLPSAITQFYLNLLAFQTTMTLKRISKADCTAMKRYQTIFITQRRKSLQVLSRLV